MFIQEEYLEQARKIHRECPVADAHFDLAAEVYERRLSGEQNVVEQRYLPHFQEAGLNILVSSIYLTNRASEGAGADHGPEGGHRAGGRPHPGDCQPCGTGREPGRRPYLSSIVPGGPRSPGK